MCNEREQQGSAKQQDSNCEGCNLEPFPKPLPQLTQDELRGLQRKLDRQEYLRLALNDPDIRPFYDHASIVRMEEELAQLDLTLPKPPPLIDCGDSDLLQIDELL